MLARPNLIIIGAMKAGTTSLRYYLNLHPEICMSREKELDFFVEAYNWSKGVPWYTAQFKGKGVIHGEASPNYSAYPYFPGVPERIHALLPEVKLIYILRDPIERMISHYLHNYCEGNDHRSFEEAFGEMNHNVYLYRSQYFMQLEQYLQYYPPSQLLVIAAEDLLHQRRATLQRVFEFLNVTPDVDRYRFRIQRHSTARKRRKTPMGYRLAATGPLRLLRRVPQRLIWPLEDMLFMPFSRKVERPVLDDTLRKHLHDHLKEDVRHLRAFTGDSFSAWSL